jgi:hypothetical protein
MTTLISTCNTKSEFQRHVRDGVNVHMFDAASNHMVSLRDVENNIGHSFTVTNRQRRWFASVTVKAGRRLVTS